MGQLTKTINFSNDVLRILSGMQVQQQNGNFVGVLTCGQLDRKMYDAVNKALDALGGKWSRKAGGHIFTVDPREKITDLLDSGSVKVVKEGWFPTPLPVVEQMVSVAGGIGGLILEPSAGEGHIVDALIQMGASIDDIYCVEKNPDRAKVLRDKGYAVYVNDFMELEFHKMKFDRVFMNPPFENGQDIEHTQQAFIWLKPGGVLVGIMSESPFFRNDKKAVEFREWFDIHQGRSWELPDNAFKESGTGVKTRLVKIERRIAEARRQMVMPLFGGGA
jgi:hypothetical protein